jgi:hypothetical protein
MGEFISVQGRKALDQVADWLERGAPHVDINGRKIDNFDMAYAVQDDGCGTSCCVAGAVVQFNNLGKLDETGTLKFWDEGGYDGAEKLATEFLGISEEDAGQLFMPWTSLELENEVGESPRAARFSDPIVAGKVIRTYLTTGQIDWVASGAVLEYDEDPDFFDY